MVLDLSSLRPNLPTPATPSPSVSSDAYERIRRLPMFEGVEESQTRAVADCGSVRSYPAGSVVVTEGDPCNGEGYAILSGSVEVSAGGRTVARLGTGDVFGEYALVSDEARTATVRAAEPMECFVFDEDSCIRISNENDLINRLIVERMSEDAAPSEAELCASA